MIEKLERYEMIAVTRCGEGWQELQKENEGSWVEYSAARTALDNAAKLAPTRAGGSGL